jgi:hypothetical protein
MTHLVLQNQHLQGWEYGIVRSFEDAICKLTGASLIHYPRPQIPKKLLPYFSQGYKRAKYRHLLPKTEFTPSCDVLWVVLMGPETYNLDLYQGWQKSAKKKVVYLCDTLPFQMDTIKRLFSDNDIDLCITAFAEAIPELEKVTGRKWHGLVQAAPVELFYPTPMNERLIHFSAYGRRFPAFHELLIDFCAANNLYYDYTTHDGRHPAAPPLELYEQYAWHVRHSLFNVSWPVELTNPQRAGSLRPITPRWFEGGLSGCILLGQGPQNDMFLKELCNDIVVNFDPFAEKQQMFRQLDNIWSSRIQFFQQFQQHAKANRERWGWENRVNTILDLISN